MGRGGRFTISELRFTREGEFTHSAVHDEVHETIDDSSTRRGEFVVRVGWQLGVLPPGETPGSTAGGTPAATVVGERTDAGGFGERRSGAAWE